MITKSYLKLTLCILGALIFTQDVYAGDLEISWPPDSGYYYTDGMVIGQNGCVIEPTLKVTFAGVSGSRLTIGFHAKPGSLFRAVFPTDNDGDGLPDSWQEYYWGDDPNAPRGPGDDPDGDGATNIEEYNGQSDPTSELSLPIVRETVYQYDASGRTTEQIFIGIEQ